MRLSGEYEAVAVDDRDGDRPNTSRGFELPHDIPGRFACILAGLFFSICGITALVGLLENGFRMAVFGFYELSAAAAVFGIALVLWGPGGSRPC